MEANLPEWEVEPEVFHTNPGEAWTESEWFHGWLRLARGSHDEAANDYELPARAA
jgi:hypothetical protein